MNIKRVYLLFKRRRTIKTRVIGASEEYSGSKNGLIKKNSCRLFHSLPFSTASVVLEPSMEKGTKWRTTQTLMGAEESITKNEESKENGEVGKTIVGGMKK